MMDYIVERLRRFRLTPNIPTILDEGADEIERLRAQIPDKDALEIVLEAARQETSNSSDDEYLDELLDAIAKLRTTS